MENKDFQNGYLVGIASMGGTGRLINIPNNSIDIDKLDCVSENILQGEIDNVIPNGSAVINAIEEYAGSGKAGNPNGAAILNDNGKINAENLPSYVDDVIEGYYNTNDGKFYKSYIGTTHTFIDVINGERGIIYINLLNNLNNCFRWISDPTPNGSYVEISNVNIVENITKNATNQQVAGAKATWDLVNNSARTISLYESAIIRTNLYDLYSLVSFKGYTPSSDLIILCSGSLYYDTNKTIANSGVSAIICHTFIETHLESTVITNEGAYYVDIFKSPTTGQIVSSKCTNLFTIDTSISDTSTNAVQNKVISGALKTKANLNDAVLGENAFSTSASGIAIGKNAKSSGNAIQIGEGENSNGGTMQVKSYELLDTDGKIPNERLNIATQISMGNPDVVTSGLVYEAIQDALYVDIGDVIP